MIIRDKQDLRKCVKQCVRRAQVIETQAQASLVLGEYGVDVNLRSWAPTCDSLQASFERACAGSPLAGQPARLLAALDALQLPTHDLDKAQSIILGYDRSAYLNAVLSAMRARKVLVRVAASDNPAEAYADERIAPLVVADDTLFAPGRYGVDYESAAQKIAQALQRLNAKDVMPDSFSLPALEYCLIPVCEDESAVLHVHTGNEEQLHALLALLKKHPGVRAIVSTAEELEPVLIRAVASMREVLVQLRCTRAIPLALDTFGTRFIPYASCAAAPEEMLGGWVHAREALWQTLYEAYLLLARSGFELTRERIEMDAEMLLCGNYERLHEGLTEHGLNE